MRSSGAVNIRVNGWINLHLNVNHPDNYSEYPLRPYHALLPFTGDDSVQLPSADTSPAIARLLEVAKPNKSFRDLQLETDLPLAHIYRLASHLVYWRKAKIINMMTKNNIYILTPDRSSHTNSKINYGELAAKFAVLFQHEIKFHDILLRFSTPRPLAEHISKFHQTYHVTFLQIVGWLLQHDLITQLHTYVHLMCPTSLRYVHISEDFII
eukprot:gene10789-12572_t